MGIALAALLGQIGLPGGGFGHGYGSMADVGAPRVPLPAARVPPGPQPGRHVHPGRADHRRCSRTPDGTLDYDGQRAAACPTSGSCTGPAATRSTTTRTSTGCDARSPGPTPSSCTSRSGPRPPATPTSCSRARPRSNATTSARRRSDGYLIAMPRALPPLGEARDDYEAFSELAKRLDVWDDFTEGRTARDWVEHIYDEFRERGARPRRRRARRSTTFWEAGEARLPADARATTRCSSGSAPIPDAHPLADAERPHRAVLRDDRRLRLRRLPRPSGVARARGVARRPSGPRASRCT